MAAEQVRSAFSFISKTYLAAPDYTLGAVRHHLIALARLLFDGAGLLFDVNTVFGIPGEAETRTETIIRQSFLDSDAALDIMVGLTSTIARIYGKDEAHAASGYTNTCLKDAMTTEKVGYSVYLLRRLTRIPSPRPTTRTSTQSRTAYRLVCRRTRAHYQPRNRQGGRKLSAHPP